MHTNICCMFKNGEEDENVMKNILIFISIMMHQFTIQK